MFEKYDNGHTYDPRDFFEREDTFKDELDTVARYVFGDYFQRRRDTDWMETLRQLLDEAAMTEGPVLYASRTALYSVLIGGLGLSLGLIISAIVVGLGLLSFGLGQGSLPYFVEFVLGMLDAVLVGISTTLVVTLLFGGGTFIGMVLKPWYIKDQRKREISRNLSYVMTFMYALSRGGMNIIKIMESVSESGDAYGEVSNEFQAIVRDLEYMDTDVRKALIQRSESTPSEDFERFIDDMVNMLDSGSDMTPFFKRKSEEYIEQARREQENFLEMLSLLGEGYVTAFVAGPLLLIIIITTMSLIGGSKLMMLYGIIYGMLPLGSMAFAVIISILSEDDSTSATLESPYSKASIEDLKEKNAELESDMIDRIIDLRRRERYEEMFSNPVGNLINNPEYTFVITFPLMLLTYFTFISTGLAKISLDAFIHQSGIQTTFWIVIPLFVLLVPYSVFYEWGAYRERAIVSRLSSVMKKISNANETGLTLAESFELASENTRGRIGEELKYVANDIEWNLSINDSLTQFANRIKDPRLARTIKLITKANEASGQITQVLDIAVNDLSNSQKLKQERKNEMRIYTMIIILSYFVYLFVIMTLDSRFLTKIENIASKMSKGEGGGSSKGGGKFNLAGLPIDQFRMLFYHSSIVQALGSGMVAGQMGSGSLRAGLKYSLILMFISMFVFVFML